MFLPHTYSLKSRFEILLCLLPYILPIPVHAKPIPSCNLNNIQTFFLRKVASPFFIAFVCTKAFEAQFRLNKWRHRFILIRQSTKTIGRFCPLCQSFHFFITEEWKHGFILSLQLCWNGAVEVPEDSFTRS